MRDPIEDFVSRNRKSFDDQVPSPKVWNQLEKQLPERRQRKRDDKIIKLQRRFVWAAAAAAVFLVAAVGFWMQNTQLKNQTDSMQVAEAETLETVDEETVLEMLPEFQTVSAEFTEDIDQYLHDLKAFPDAEAEVREELRELDEHFEMLKQELGNDFSSEEIVEAMVENYRLKLDILERTLAHLKRNAKPRYHEVEI